MIYNFGAATTAPFFMPKSAFAAAIKSVQVNNATEPDLELHFLDTITDSFDWYTWEETNLVKDVIDRVNAAKPKKIRLVINSQGGDASIGLAIYNFLRNYNCKKETDVIGMAGSIASVMAMVADKGKLRMARNSFMVIHRAWGWAQGNSDEMRAAADVIDKFTLQVVDVYHQRTGKPKEEIEALIANGDYWMTATEAKELGFCDEVYADNAEFKVAACVASLNSYYQNIPAALKNESTPQNNFFQTLQTEFMNIKKLVSNFIAGVKNEAPADKPEGTAAAGAAAAGAAAAESAKPEVSNEAAAFANSIEKPLTEFLNELKKEVEDTVSNSVKNSQEFKDLEKKVNDLVDENKNLTDQLKELTGGEGKGSDGGGQKNEVAAFGSFS